MDKTTWIPICAACFLTGLGIGVLFFHMCKKKGCSCGSSGGDAEAQGFGRGSSGGGAGAQGNVPTQENSRTPLLDATTNKDEKKQMVRVMDTLKIELETLKTEMENQRKDVKRKLDEVDEEKKKNKEKLQDVEKKLKEREENYDKPEELLKEKEERLRTEWRLDKEKRLFEKQQSNLNKLMDPVETLVTRITRDPQ